MPSSEPLERKDEWDVEEKEAEEVDDGEEGGSSRRVLRLPNGLAEEGWTGTRAADSEMF